MCRRKYRNDQLCCIACWISEHVILSLVCPFACCDLILWIMLPINHRIEMTPSNAEKKNWIWNLLLTRLKSLLNQAYGYHLTWIILHGVGMASSHWGHPGRLMWVWKYTRTLWVKLPNSQWMNHEPPFSIPVIYSWKSMTLCRWRLNNCTINRFTWRVRSTLMFTLLAQAFLHPPWLVKTWHGFVVSLFLSHWS